PAHSEIVTLSLHDALPIYQDLVAVALLEILAQLRLQCLGLAQRVLQTAPLEGAPLHRPREAAHLLRRLHVGTDAAAGPCVERLADRKSTRLNSSHDQSSYA